MDIHVIDKNLNHVFVFLMFIINLSYSSFDNDGASPMLPGRLNLELDCSKWNATIITKGDSPRKLLLAMFEPFPGYERCFTYYKVYLYLLKPNHFECDLSNGVFINHKTVHQYDQEKHRSYKITFTNLEARYYCIMIRPCAGQCYEALLSSNVIRIIKMQTATSKENVTSEVKLSRRSDIFYMFVILSFTLLFSIIIYWNYKHRKVRKMPESVVENGEKLPFLKPSNTEVFILYSSDGNTKRLVDCLADFLQNCAEFNVTVIDDRNVTIHFEPYSWLDEHLQCCSMVDGKCSCNRRVIVVMTDWVLNYLQAKRKAVKSLHEIEKTEDEGYAISSFPTANNDMQADWFCYGLNKILIDWSKCMKDYSHFFVVYFDDKLYDESDDIIMIAHDVRFSIQHHLLKLCQNMNYTFKDIALKNKLKKCLDEHPIKDIVSTTYPPAQ